MKTKIFPIDIQKHHKSNIIYIYSDGGCRLKYNIGVWSFNLNQNERYFETGEVVLNDPEIKNVTSIKMEITASINSLKYLKSKIIPIILTTDSEYVSKGLNEWSKYWITHDWRNKQGKKIENIEFWKDLLSLRDSFFNIQILHTPGHSDNLGNERCDQICNELMDKYLQDNKHIDKIYDLETYK